MASLRASPRLAVAAQQVDLICPSHENYKHTDLPTWPKDSRGFQLDIAIYGPDDHQYVTQLVAGVLGDPSLTPLMRAAVFYTRLPPSYIHRMWRKEADNLVANRHDIKLTPDTSFLHTRIRDSIWSASVCVSNFPSGEPTPWINDCKEFAIRKKKWDDEIENSVTCYHRWVAEDIRRRTAMLRMEQGERRRIKIAAELARLEAEKRLSAAMFNPIEFEDGDEIIKEIINGIKPVRDINNPTHPAHVIFQTMIGLFPQKNTLTFLDFQCLIADYFHDNMPGFRIAHKGEKRISGIRVYDPSIIATGKRENEECMHTFLKNVLDMMRAKKEPSHLRTVSQTLHSTPGSLTFNNKTELKEWAKTIDLKGEIERSLVPIMGLSPLEDNYEITLTDAETTHPMILYDSFLQSGKRNIVIKFKPDDTRKYTTFNSYMAVNVLTFLLVVLFGPSYQQKIASDPALFTFDAHKGHLSRIISKAELDNVYRLITPYNVADSAMTENFSKKEKEKIKLAQADQKKEEEDEEAVQAAVAAAAAPAVAAPADAMINEEEEGEKESVSAQDGKSIYAISLQHALSIHRAPIMGHVAYDIPDAIMSDTNMIFDDNWLIYYKAKGFARGSEFNFSMNLVDVGLHHYIQEKRKREKAKYNIPPSMYTIEAPFSSDITRGPSLNYLMMGLVRGSHSEVFGRDRFASNDTLYENLCGLHTYVTTSDVVKQLLPIYSIPASTHALPLFEHIAKAPLFAYHMLYDLQHGISALPSRIKWAGDREQYMVLKGYDHGVFVTLDTTGYYCALANNVPSLLERDASIYLMNTITLTAQQIAAVAAEAAGIKAGAKKGKLKGNPSATASAQQGTKREKITAKKGGRNLRVMDQNVFPQANQLTRKNVRGSPQAKIDMFMFPQPLKKMVSFPEVNKEIQTNVHSSLEEDRPYVIDRNYFFLGWLYPIVAAVNEAFYESHPAEHAYTILQDLKEHIHHPRLFPILQGQFIYAVSKIPNVSEELMTHAKEITGDTYEDVVDECVGLLRKKYAGVSSIFSNPVHKRTILGYLHEMKEKLSKKYSSKDSTLNLLHTLLDQPNQVSCLALSLLFERLHGRIHNKTSYLGEILGIDKGDALERVDDQEAWEHLTTVLQEDVKQITTILKKAGVSIEEPAELTQEPAELTQEPAELVEEQTNVHNAGRHSSMKKHRVVRKHAHRLWKRDLQQLRHPKRGLYHGSRRSRGKTQRSRQTGRRVTARGSKHLE